MSGEHPSPEALERFMRGELNPRDSRRLVRHLIAGCAECIELTRRFWALGEESVADAIEPCPADAHRSLVHPASYRDVFERLYATGEERQALLTRERQDAPGLLTELLGHPQARRLALIGGDDRLRSLSLCELLLGPSRTADAPEAALELTELAVAVAERLDAGFHGRSVVDNLKVRAWAARSNAHRAAGDLADAERAAQVADVLLESGDAEPLDRVELLTSRARLRLDQGRRAEAVELLDRAVAICRQVGHPQHLGRALIGRGELGVELGEGEPAADLLREGLKLLDEQLEPRVAARALQALARSLAAAGRSGEALLALQRARPLHRKLGDRTSLLGLRWLEGRIALALSRPDEAESAWGEALHGLTAEGRGREAAAVACDLAALYAGQGRVEAAQQLNREIFPLLRSNAFPGRAFSLLLVFQWTLDNEGADAELCRELAGSLLGPRRETWVPAGSSAAR